MTNEVHVGILQAVLDNSDRHQTALLHGKTLEQIKDALTLLFNEHHNSGKIISLSLSVITPIRKDDADGKSDNAE
jgi:hypothetical protein